MATKRALSLRGRLAIAFTLVAAAVLSLAVTSNIALRNLGGAIGTILVENYASVIACEDMTEALERLDSAALFSMSGQDVLAAPMQRENRAAFEKALAREKTNITLPGEGELTDVVEREYRGYVVAVDSALAAPAPRTTERYFHELLPLFTSLKGHVRDISLMNQLNMVSADQRARETASVTTDRSTVLGMSIVLLVVALAFWLPSAITKPLAPLGDATKRVGEGDLDQDVPMPNVAELVPFAQAFNSMLGKLRAYRASSLGELLEAKDLARTTVACLDDPVVVVDREGNVLLANPSFSETFGIEEATHEDLFARGISLPAAISEAVEGALEARGRGRGPTLAEAMKHASKEGDRYFLVRAAKLSGEAEEQQRVLVVLQDVTRFRQIDEVKSSIVATVSHEFKTPLTSLRMATHMLLENNNGPLTETQRELVTTALDDTERLRKLVEEFLDLTRIEAEAGALRRTQAELRRILEDAAASHRAIAEQKGVEIVVEADPSAHASVDQEKLAVVISNLLSNAIRHTPRGGKVVLGATQSPAGAKLTVKDTGEGISEDELPRIFDRFHRGTEDAQDPLRMGLGLAIAREIIHQHGGTLRVETSADHGTVFTVSLPDE